MRAVIGMVLSIFFFTLADGSPSDGKNTGDARQSDILPEMDSDINPYVLVLGIAQDGGVPQAGTKQHPGWDDDEFRRHVVCLAVVDPALPGRWMIDCTPDFPKQLHMLDGVAPVWDRLGLEGIFLTHAHMGHYMGLAYLGHEVMGTSEVPVYAMPRMLEYLNTNGPWDQLVRYKNIKLERLEEDVSILLTPRLEIEPFLVPHRQEYSEVVGYRIRGPNRTVLYIPDIDSWEEWDEAGPNLVTVLSEVDVAYLDGTFYDGGEMPGRDMSGFPHPFITHTMELLGSLPLEERQKVRFLHLNHTNPALHSSGSVRTIIETKGFKLAEEMERVEL